MAEAVLGSSFDVWLKETLIELNTDDEVFSPYIIGILEAEDTHEGKIDALKDILTEVTQDNVETLCQNIIEKWSLKCSEVHEDGANKEIINLDAKLTQFMDSESQKLRSPVSKPLNTEQQKLKHAILAQYAEVSEEEEEVGGDEENKPIFVSKNINVENVMKAEKEKHEKEKEEAKKKKEKDKEDRTKQKAKSDERKEKEKKRTQKGERRR